MKFIDALKKASEGFITFHHFKYITMLSAMAFYSLLVIYFMSIIVVINPIIGMILVAPAIFSIFILGAFLDEVYQYWN